MSDEGRYFVYVREGSYAKSSSDRNSLYRFKDGKPVKVVNYDDQLKFAGNRDFIETDSKGDPIDSSNAMPSNNASSENGSPLSYVSMGAKGAESSAPKASKKEAKADKKEEKSEDKEEDKDEKKDKKSKKSKKSSKKSKKDKKDKKDDEEEKDEKEDK